MTHVTGQAERRRFDVFLSLSGLDREQVRVLVGALRKAGLEVFLDEDRIPLFAGVTAEIEAALRSAKIVVVYYSASFPSRPACQFELTAAFLAGQAEGDPSRRIVVINPEPGTDHLQPVELADDRFAVLPAPGRDRQAIAAIVSRIRERVDAVSGGIGGVSFTSRPRWFTDRLPGSHGFVGRYRDQWRLHSTLHAADRSLTQDVSGAPVAVLVGLPGIGKTALAAAYAWQFGAAYLGGIFWISLAGVGTLVDDVSARYADEVRTVAELVGLPVDSTSRTQLFGLLADWIAARPAPCLWIIDDLPPDVDPEVVNTLVIPAGTHVRTVIISQRFRPSRLVSTVEVGPMTLPDAELLLRAFRGAETPEEAVALERVARRLDGHAHALNLAGRILKDRQGLMSYADYAHKLDADPSTSAAIAEPVRSALSCLDTAQKSILQLSLICSPAALPVQLIDRVMVSPQVHPAGQPSTVGAALSGLRQSLLASRTGTLWEVHSIVRDAAREHLDSPWPSADLARVAADAIVALLTGSEVIPTVRTLLIHHGEAVATRADLPAGPHEALLRQIADYYESRGEPILASPYRERILHHHPDSPHDLVAAATVQHQAGHHEKALAHAAKVLRFVRHDDEGLLRYRCHRIQAEALDALGRATEADLHWSWLLHGEAERPVQAVEHWATRLARVRSLRLRGRMQEAELLLKTLINDPENTANPTVIDERQAALTELARIQVMTDDQITARQTAAAVVQHYHDRGLEGHSNALAAQQVFADAQLAIHLWELRPDPTGWVRAEQALRQLRDDYRRTHGRRNSFTLSTSVAHAQALVSLGRPEQARDELASHVPDILLRLGERHPLYYQATFLLGQVYSQLGEYGQAAGLYAIAFDGQRATLGSDHPQTLRTQFELGIALKLVGEVDRAAAMIRAVRRAAPRSTGRITDLFAQAIVATVLMRLPTWIWRTIGKQKPRRHRDPSP